MLASFQAVLAHALFLSFSLFYNIEVTLDIQREEKRMDKSA